jgi:hypothetical protein
LHFLSRQGIITHKSEKGLNRPDVNAYTDTDNPQIEYQNIIIISKPRLSNVNMLIQASPPNSIKLYDKTVLHIHYLICQYYYGAQYDVNKIYSYKGI